jgi:replicative DNA helicase
MTTLTNIPVRKTYTTTIPEIDELTGGFLSSSINLIQAGTGLGKSNFLLRVAVFYAMAGVKVHYVSTEMTEVEFWPRMLAFYKEGIWDDYKFNSEEGKVRAVAAHKEFMEKCGENIKITLTSEVENIAKEISLAANEFASEVVLIDHFHQLSSTSGLNSLSRQEFLLKHVIQLKNDLNLCFLVASQLSKDVIKSGRNPTQHDGKGLSDLAENATHILYFYMSEEQANYNYRGPDSLRQRELNEPYQITLWLSKTRERPSNDNYQPLHCISYDAGKINFQYLAPILKK